MKRSLTILFCLSLFLATCTNHSDKPESSIDPDIVLINIQQGGREFIGKVLQKLDSLNPLAIGIDITFQGQKKQDSILIAALKKLKKDVLVYSAKQDGLLNGSDSVFTDLAEQGSLYYEQRLGLITTMIPLQKINERVHESFAFKIIKQWKPNFTSPIKVNEKIEIHYTRDLKKFTVINGTDLLNSNAKDPGYSNKIFLVGYAGPGNDDKYFTPMRIKDKDYKANEPDTYGLVIIANEIRTILEYND